MHINTLSPPFNYSTHLESLADLLLRIGVFHLTGHHREKLCHVVNNCAPSFDWFRVPGKSMVPLLSASTSLIMSCSSLSEGFWPSDRMTVPSSLVVICPVVVYQCHVLRIISRTARPSQNTRSLVPFWHGAIVQPSPLWSYRVVASSAFRM